MRALALCDVQVGAKSKNLALLRGKLPDDIQLPASVTLPFGCFEQVGRAASGEGGVHSIKEWTQIQGEAACRSLGWVADIVCKGRVKGHVFSKGTNAQGGGMLCNDSTGRAIRARHKRSGWGHAMQ